MYIFVIIFAYLNRSKESPAPAQLENGRWQKLQNLFASEEFLTVYHDSPEE